MKTKSLTIFTVLTVLTLLAVVCVGCKDTYSSDDKTYPVSGRTYIEEKYGGVELHFAKKGNTLKLVEHSEAGTTDRTNQFFIMNADTIFTYNNTQYNDIRNAYIYHDTYLTSYWGDDEYRLTER